MKINTQPEQYGSSVQELVSASRSLLDVTSPGHSDGDPEYVRATVEVVAQYLNRVSRVAMVQALRLSRYWLLDEERQDHSDIIASLRLQGEQHQPGVVRNRLLAAAALLETHDATGINLSTFGPVEDFVNDVIHAWFDRDTSVIDNGV